jgi:sec-independent protein translocase protein TatC
MHASFLSHIKELRTRLLVVCFFILSFSVIVFFFFDFWVALISKPYLQLGLTNSDTLYVQTIFEGFSTKVKFSFLFGFVLSFPAVLFHFLRFLFPGLKKKEKRALLGCVLIGSFLAIVSAYFSYTFLLPLSIQFLSSSSFIPENVGIILNYRQNLFYVCNVLLGTMIVFQFPIVLFFLLNIGIIKRKNAWLWGRYIIVLSFILSAIATPPDVVSQIAISLPLISLYYLTLVIAKAMNVGS